MVICLYGASSQKIHPDYLTGVESFGAAMGRRGHTLLFGGGDKGLMGAAARGVKAENGRVIGVAPRFFNVDGVLFPRCDEFFYTVSRIKRSYPGTGDLFASVLLGKLLSGEDFYPSLVYASDFVGRVMEYSSKFDTPLRDGVAFEPFLSEIADKNRI